MKINKIKLPIAITTYIIILGTFNVLQGFFSTFSPGSIVDMVNNTGLRLEGEGANTIIWLWAARSAASGFLFLLVLFVFRTRETLLAILIGRLFIDIFDTSTIAAAGLLDVTRGLTQLLYLIPVSLIIYYLIKVGGKKD